MLSPNSRGYESCGEPLFLQIAIWEHLLPFIPFITIGIFAFITIYSIYSIYYWGNLQMCAYTYHSDPDSSSLACAILVVQHQLVLLRSCVSVH